MLTYIATKSGAPAIPSSIPLPSSNSSEIDYLREINDWQYQMDTAARKLKYKQWCLFSVWWSYVSDINNSDPARIAFYKSLVDKYRSQAAVLTKLISDPSTGLAGQIERVVRKKRNQGPIFRPLVEARSIPQSTFFQRRDPTLCIAGMDSGWPAAYMGIVPVRLNTQIRQEATPLFPKQITLSNISRILGILLKEALSTQSHGQILGFKTWTAQPWCPLFVEWEATYFHIPFNKWSVDILNSPVDNNHGQVRYGVSEVLSQHSEDSSDQRTLSGRAVLLPQPVVNLKALVAQVLNDPGVTLTPAQITDLNANIDKLKFTSVELSGITTNLLTLGDGSHVQPNVQHPALAQSFPLAATLAAGAGIDITQADMTLMAQETALTPYGSLVQFPQAINQPFKGVTHGQLRFSKLNIVDKFGQVISAIPPSSPLKTQEAQKDTIYPCLSDQVCPGLVKGSTKLNTVTPLTTPDPQQPGGFLCPYVQLTPAINQAARLNAAFVESTTDSNSKFTGWRAVDDWEQPVWAW
jgi:hypothetical protein